jgi:hypothetical protein
MFLFLGEPQLYTPFGIRRKTVWRRFREFYSLYAALQKSFPNARLPRFPRKTSLGRFRDVTIRERVYRFGRFLESLCNHAEIISTTWVRDFLGLDDDQDGEQEVITDDTIAGNGSVVGGSQTKGVEKRMRADGSWASPPKISKLGKSIHDGGNVGDSDDDDGEDQNGSELSMEGYSGAIRKSTGLGGGSILTSSSVGGIHTRSETDTATLSRKGSGLLDVEDAARARGSSDMGSEFERTAKLATSGPAA